MASGINPANWYNTPNWLVWPRQPEGYPAFRMFCEFSHLNYDDPIVYPGQKDAAHLHMYFGNTQTNYSQDTYREVRTQGATSTCTGGAANRTAYWMPALFDTQGRVVPPSTMELYYKAENVWDNEGIQNLREYPNGLRMIAGAMGGSNRSDWGWRCDSGPNLTTIPDCNGGRLTGWVRFPYCWDGVNLDSPDHRSHMSLGVNNGWGRCPSSHPVNVPELTEIFHWDNSDNFNQYYLSSDRAGMITPAPNGSTFHADWFGGWEDSIETKWVNNCLRNGHSVSLGDLCDGTMLVGPANYTGGRISGYFPTASG